MKQESPCSAGGSVKVINYERSRRRSEPLAYSCLTPGELDANLANLKNIKHIFFWINNQY